MRLMQDGQPEHSKMSRNLMAEKVCAGRLQNMKMDVQRLKNQARTAADATPRRPVAIRKSAGRDNFNLASGVGRVGIQIHRKAKTKGDTRGTGPLEQKI